MLNNEKSADACIVCGRLPEKQCADRLLEDLRSWEIKIENLPSHQLRLFCSLTMLALFSAAAGFNVGTPGVATSRTNVQMNVAEAAAKAKWLANSQFASKGAVVPTNRARAPAAAPAYVAPPAVPTGERTVNPALAKALKSADKAKKKDFVYSSKPVEPAICGTRLAEGWTTGKAGIGK